MCTGHPGETGTRQTHIAFRRRSVGTQRLSARMDGRKRKVRSNTASHGQVADALITGFGPYPNEVGWAEFHGLSSRPGGHHRWILLPAQGQPSRGPLLKPGFSAAACPLQVAKLPPACRPRNPPPR